MNLILIAPPAAGKGTMASMLHEKYGLVCISAGELLRGVDPNTELGKEIRDLQSRRELVDDRITNQLMKERLMKDDVKNGFILDGYPRHMPQVEAIKGILEELNLKIDYALLLNVDYELALKRTLGRQICRQDVPQPPDAERGSYGGSSPLFPVPVFSVLSHPCPEE